MFRSRIPARLVVMFAVALIFATAAYGFAASNTVPTSNAGDGSGTISGYTVSAVHYTLNATNPANIDTVTFTVAPAIPATGSVVVKLVSSGTTFKTCTPSGTPARESPIGTCVTGTSSTLKTAV